MKKKLKKLTAFMVSATMVFPIFGEYPSGTFKLGWDSSFSASAVEDLSPAEEITVTIDTGESVTLNDNDNDGYYDIGTADELYAFASIVNNCNTAINVELTTDITVNDNVLITRRSLVQIQPPQPEKTSKHSRFEVLIFLSFLSLTPI